MAIKREAFIFTRLQHECASAGCTPAILRLFGSTLQRAVKLKANSTTINICLSLPKTLKFLLNFMISYISTTVRNCLVLKFNSKNLNFLSNFIISYISTTIRNCLSLPVQTKPSIVLRPSQVPTHFLLPACGFLHQSQLCILDMCFSAWHHRTHQWRRCVHWDICTNYLFSHQSLTRSVSFPLASMD